MKRLILILLTCLVLGTALTACRPSPKLMSMTEEITGLAGTWTDQDYLDCGTDGFRADITEDGIVVYYGSQGNDALYWSGTLPMPETDGEQIILLSESNTGDEDAVCICCDSTKMFAYEQGEISFTAGNGDTRTLSPDVDQT